MDGGNKVSPKMILCASKATVGSNAAEKVEKGTSLTPPALDVIAHFECHYHTVPVVSLRMKPRISPW